MTQKNVFKGAPQAHPSHNHPSEEWMRKNSPREGPTRVPPPPTRVPRASDPRKPPQEWLPLASNKKASNKHKLALRECPTTASHRGAQQVPRNYEFPTRVPLKNPHECPTRSAAQIAAREHPARGPYKSALLQKCLAKVLLRKCFKNSVPLSIPNPSVLKPLRSIAFSYWVA